MSNFSIKALNILAVVFENSLNTLITVAYLSLVLMTAFFPQTLFSFCLLTCLVIFFVESQAYCPTPVFLPGESPWTEEPEGL